MSYTLPSQAEANSQSSAAYLNAQAKAYAAFIANATVLINNATANGLYEVQPFVIPFLNIPNVVTYFQNLGYTVLFPIVPPGPFLWCGPAAGFPEVIPPGLSPYGCQCWYPGPPRIQISWSVYPPTPAVSWLWLETSGNGDLLLLEDGIDGILLE